MRDRFQGTGLSVERAGFKNDDVDAFLAQCVRRCPTGGTGSDDYDGGVIVAVVFCHLRLRLRARRFWWRRQPGQIIESAIQIPAFFERAAFVAKVGKREFVVVQGNDGRTSNLFEE